MSTEREAKVYVNGSLVGTHENPEQLAEQIREARRRGEVSEMVNVSVKDRTGEVIVNADAGRARRPLLVVEDGEPVVTQQEVEALENGDIEFEDLVREGKVEFIDAEEEEDILVGVDEEGEYLVGRTEAEHVCLRTHIDTDCGLMFRQLGHYLIICNEV